MANYFHYFTEIEDRFQQRRGTLTMLSTLDWALIETWREAGVPLEAVLRGIDEAFDKHDARVAKGTRRIGKVNGLAWAAQSVMLATEQMKEAAVGGHSTKPAAESGFEAEKVAAYLAANADRLLAAQIAEPAGEVLRHTAARLQELAEATAELPSSPPTEALETNLLVMEEKLYAALLLVTPEADQVAWREQAARGLAGNRGGMSPVHVKQVTQQFLNKRVLDAHGLPRLSLFYMEHR